VSAEINKQQVITASPKSVQCRSQTICMPSYLNTSRSCAHKLTSNPNFFAIFASVLLRIIWTGIVERFGRTAVSTIEEAHFESFMALLREEAQQPHSQFNGFQYDILRRPTDSVNQVGNRLVMSAAIGNKFIDCTHLLSDDDVQDKLLEVAPLWKLSATDEDEYAFIFRSFTCKNFQRAMDALNAFGVIAERENHHPDFHLTNYRDVLVEIWTHKLKGVTENDILLAQMLDKEVPIKYSPK
jgi:4a-hydroxytetrahydrobiopterin dehydratase